MSVTTSKEGIPVKNAGLVIVNNYVPMLFERLGLMQNRAFVNASAQEQAVQFLQYVATGLTNTEARFLQLNKVLCGLPLAHPVPEEIEISDEQEKLINGLITSMLSYWPDAGTKYLDGFRGNWLVRDGLLIESADSWELKVERRAYDVLLNKSPFSFSNIKYPWMDKPLHVVWKF
ncbi:contractile injection system tape measure protein [Taibaiella soli]|uniref:Uncharacterized protein n=1 Tax=Taibaiella soli TaxID=1649169 RepID=A0A2W2B3X9_9BACT|nr:contractile injection system tape measure protein [Taibaiella soli]PZF74748.1 hypothetical protein DN068_00690 [Taibaiella soli]